MNTDKLLEMILDELKDDSVIHKPVPWTGKVPTLKMNVYRNASPMLTKRFDKIGAWEDATHGDWLNIREMELFWNDTNMENERLVGIGRQIKSAIGHWEGNAGSKFKKEELSVFAASAYSKEHIYLRWLEKREEPELWVYDVNGESKYDNLDSYLKSYIEDDY